MARSAYPDDMVVAVDGGLLLPFFCFPAWLPIVTEDGIRTPFLDESVVCCRREISGEESVGERSGQSRGEWKQPRVSPSGAREVIAMVTEGERDCVHNTRRSAAAAGATGDDGTRSPFLTHSLPLLSHSLTPAIEGAIAGVAAAGAAWQEARVPGTDGKEGREGEKQRGKC